MTSEWIWGKPLIEDFNNQFQKGYSEMQPDAGIPFRKINFTKIYDLVTCKFILDRTDYLRFMSWYKYDIKQGKENFTFFDCRYGVNRTAQLVGDVPQYSTVSNRYDLSVVLAFDPTELE